MSSWLLKKGSSVDCTTAALPAGAAAAKTMMGNDLVLPENSSELPVHPSTKLLPAKSRNLKRSEGSIINAVKAQIAKEKEIEKTNEPVAATESNASLAILSPHLRTKEGTECFGNTDSVNCIELFPNGEFASGSGDGRILIWNEGTGEVVQILQNHQGPVLSMKANALGRKLITGSSDMSIKKWDLVQTVIKQDHEFRGHTRWVQCVALQGNSIFSASLDKTVRQWNMHTGKCSFIFAGHADWVSSLCVHDETLYTGSWDGIIRLWNISTWECTHLFEGHAGPILAICLDVKDADAKPSLIYSASQDGSVKSWSLIDYVEVSTYTGHVLGVSTVDCCSRFLASGSFDSTIRLYDVNFAEPLHVFYGHEDSVTCVKFSANSLHLFSSSDDFTVRKWDCQMGVCLRIYGIPKSQQLIAGLRADAKKGGSLSLLLNYGDDGDPDSLRARLRKILREEENESILLEHEFSRRLELYRNRLLADHFKETEGKSTQDESVKSSDSPNLEDSVVLDITDDFQNQRNGLIAVYSDAKDALREDVLDCAGLGATAIEILWANKQEALKVAWLECQSKAAAPSPDANHGRQDVHAARVAATSILNEVLGNAISQSVEGIVEDVLNSMLDTISSAECIVEDVLNGILDNISSTTFPTPADIAEGIVNGILDFICKSELSVVPDIADTSSKTLSRNSAFDAKSASIDVSDVSLNEILTPELLVCLNSILHRANRRFHRSKSLFNTKFFESVMLQADDRDRRVQLLRTFMLDKDERKMLLEKEEVRVLGLISAEAREIHQILTQVASEIDGLVFDHRQLWLLKFSGQFSESQWNQLDSALVESITKYQSKSDEIYEEFHLFSSDAVSNDLPLSVIEERCEEFNNQLADLQKRLNEEFVQALMNLDFMTPELLARMCAIFGRDTSAAISHLKSDVDRQQKQIVDDALERARQEDIQKEEMARLAAKQALKEQKHREAEAAKAAKLESLKSSESLRMKQKMHFEMALAQSATSEDFSDLDNCGFVFTHRYDLRRRPVLILKMANYPTDPCFEGRPPIEDFEPPSDDWQQRLVRFVMVKLDSVLEAPHNTNAHVAPYLLVVDFSSSSPNRRPSILFLQQAWHFLPDRARTLMDECVIIDSPFWFRAFIWFLKPLVSPRVWRKVRFVKQYSDLWGLLSNVDLGNISSTDKAGNRTLAFSGQVSDDIHGKPSFLSMLSRARTAHLIRGEDTPEFFERYFEIINSAKVADWSEIIGLHFLDTSGVDILGRPVILFIASNFPCKLGDSFLNRCLVYIMLKVHELMFEQQKHVSILVLCSNISANNIPSTTWLQSAAKKFPYRIRKKIQCIYLLNPGFLVKKVLWVVRSIASPKTSNKIVEVETLLQLLRYFNHADLKLPPAVLQDVPFGGTPEEMKMMMADIKAAIQRGHDAGLDQKIDFSQQFKLGCSAASDHDIETFFAVTYKDFEDIRGEEIVKFAGRDLAKRPVISITLANIPASKGEIFMNKVFRLVVLLLQPLCQMPYSIALLSARFAAANQPSVDWMKDVHKSIDSAARKHLRVVYLFEPTFVVKSMSFALQSFVSTKFFKKVQLIADSDDFYQHFDPDHCKLPKSLTSQFLRAPVIQPAKIVVPLSSAVPPQFAAISLKRFEELKARKLGDFGDEYNELAQISGADIFGDPIMVIDSSKVDVSSEEAFVATVFYLLALARENIDEHESFSVAYCDDAQNDKTPSSDWLRGAYTLIPKYLRKNMKHLFCINSSQSLRIFFWFANTFVSAKFAQKIVHVMDTADLAEFLDADKTKMPPSVLERLPQATAKKMSLAMVRRSRALMSRQLAPKAEVIVDPSPSGAVHDINEESLGSSGGIIAAAHSANTSLAKDLDCVYFSNTLHGFPCVMIKVSKLPSEQHPKYREVMIALFMLLVVSIDRAQKKRADAKYCLFLSAAGSSSENRPSTEWLRAFHAQLPHEMRKNCTNVFIYMPSLALRAFVGTARLFLSSKFFKKVINLNSESAAGEYFDVSGADFIDVTRGPDQSTISKSSKSSSPVADLSDASKLRKPNDSSQSEEHLEVIPAIAPSSPAQPLITRFRNVNGKPVMRSDVPLGQRSWSAPFSSYAPTVFTSEGFPGSVRSSMRSAKNPLGHADPEDIHEVIHGLTASAFDEMRDSEEFISSLGVANSVTSTALGISNRLRFSHTGAMARNDKGYPLNPAGRTGLSGRAQHCLWGPNHCALPIIVRCSRGEREQHVQLLMTKESAASSGGTLWSLPESAAPAGHIISQQLLKELEAQALNRVDLFDDLSQQEIRSQFQTLFAAGCSSPDNILHAGVWDHAGNTDHAWSEALCVLTLLEERLADSLDYGCENAMWVPYDPSMPVKESHRPLITEAILRLSQRGVCDLHGNASSSQGVFSLAISLASLEKSASSLFAMDAFPEQAIEEERQSYEDLEKNDGLYAESTVAARRNLIVRYRKEGNASAAKALQELDRTDIVGGVQSFPSGTSNGDTGGSGIKSSSVMTEVVVPASASPISTHEEDYVDSMRRLYATRVRTLGLHDPLTVSLRKVSPPPHDPDVALLDFLRVQQLYKELCDQGRSDEAADLRSKAMSYDPN